jgi:hypothetical protein
MSVLSIESVIHDGEYFFVEAIVEDAVQVYAQTFYDPPEYGPALCSGRVYAPEYENKEYSNEELMHLIDEWPPEWRPVDLSDLYH